MPRLLQIDSCLGVLSTGRITEGIASVAKEQGWECFIAHGARYIGKSQMASYQVETKVGEYLHYAESLLLDRHGLASAAATRRLVRKIDTEIKPDIIHLHCIHGYYLNYRILFEYLNKTDIPVVWTFHDCWAFTGHCAYFDSVECKKWQVKCHDCELLSSYPKASFIDRTTENFKLKKKLFTGCRNLTLVPVSRWLEGLVNQSYFADNNVVTIHNGLNLYTFGRDKGESLEKKDYVLGVAAVWDERKGFKDFFQLRNLIDKNCQIVLVGLDDRQIESLPEGIKGIRRTHDVNELVQLYAGAKAFVNLTYSDNFPTVNLEALACGTPVITYDTGGSPEAVDDKTGVVVQQGDVAAVARAIHDMKNNPLLSGDCRRRAEELFDQEKCYRKYIDLYDRLLGKSH